MLTSIASRSSRSIKSSSALGRPVCQHWVMSRYRPADDDALVPRRLPSGAPRPPRTRSRAATGTTTGGSGSTRPARAASSRAATRATTTPLSAGHRAPRRPRVQRPTGSRVEWSRIEPEDGEFSQAALDHYRRMCATCLENGLDAIVTLHHFTTPRWVAADGRLGRAGTADCSLVSCERVAAHLGDLIDARCTFNEPNIVATIGYLAGRLPARCARPRGCAARPTTCSSTRTARRSTVLKGRSPATSRSGLTLAMQRLVAGHTAERAQARRAASTYSTAIEDVYLEAAERRRLHRRADVQPHASAPRARSAPRTATDHADGLRVLARVARGHDPPGVGVTEAHADPRHRERHRHRRRRRAHRVRRRARCEGVLGCLDDGIDVRGYTYWSLLDNFEWATATGRRSGSWQSTE